MTISAYKPRTLAQASPGERLLVLASREDSGCAQRLREFGVISGAEILLLQNGDPVLLEIKGTHLALDRQTAACIEVERV